VDAEPGRGALRCDHEEPDADRLAWLALAIVWPARWAIDARWLALGTGLVQILMIGLAVWTVRRSLRPKLIAA